jgi:hypothetical protein
VQPFFLHERARRDPQHGQLLGEILRGPVAERDGALLRFIEVYPHSIFHSDIERIVLGPKTCAVSQPLLKEAHHA